MILLFLSREARAVLFIFAFLGLNSVITLYKRYIYLPIEIEVLSFGIVFTTIAFGLKAGIAVAMLGGVLFTILTTSFSPFTVPMVLGYVVMACTAFSLRLFVPGLPYPVIGIVANVIHNLLVFTLYHFFLGYDPLKNFLFGFTNILFNIFLFLNFGDLLFSLL
jgi:hypothetical protein